jgi:glycine/D-amino acid oxidase-like deaminating enzyme
VGEVLPRASGVELEAVRVGQRAIPGDGLTVAGHVDERERLYAVVTHSGVTLAPVLARLAAEEVVGGVRADVLEPFRPQRFAAETPGQSDL